LAARKSFSAHAPASVPPVAMRTRCTRQRLNPRGLDLLIALAFGALAISPHRGLFSLGVLLAVAITLSMLASLIVLPAILTLLDRRARGRK
jgi:hypothetical protein